MSEQHMPTDHEETISIIQQQVAPNEPISSSVNQSKKALLLPDVDMSSPETFESHGSISTYTLEPGKGAGHILLDVDDLQVSSTLQNDKNSSNMNAIDSSRVDIKHATQRFSSSKNTRKSRYGSNGEDTKLDEMKDDVIRQRLRKSKEKRLFTTSREEADSFMDRYTRLLAEAQALKEEFETQSHVTAQRLKNTNIEQTDHVTDDDDDNLSTVDLQALLGSIKSIESRLVQTEDLLQPSSLSLESRMRKIKSDASNVLKGIESTTNGLTTTVPTESIHHHSQSLDSQQQILDLSNRLNKLEKWLGMNDLGTDTFKMLSSGLEGTSAMIADGFTAGHLIQSVSGLTSQSALFNGVLPGTGSLLDVMKRLDHQVSLLADPKTFESLARRTRALLPEMERLAELTRRQKLEMSMYSTSSSSSAAAVGLTSVTSTATTQTTVSKTPDEKLKDDLLPLDQKILSLYRLLQSVEPLAHTLPSLHDRLQSLQGLHAQAALCLSKVETNTQDVNDMKRILDVLEISVPTVKENMEKNQMQILENIQKLDVRLNHLLKK